MSYVPVHERVHPPSYPQYADADADMPGEPSRKRRREGSSGSREASESSEPPARAAAHSTPPPASAQPPSSAPAPAAPAAGGISPSIFGIAPRNEVTRLVGEFILQFGRGRDNLEIEIKLGTLCAPGRE